MSLPCNWGLHGINVNCLAPGWFKTEQNKMLYEDPGWVDYLCERIPLGRAARPEEQANAILFLASAEAGSVQGHAMVIDGGNIALSSGHSAPRDGL